jgi:excisionase family DNA binding protein
MKYRNQTLKYGGSAERLTTEQAAEHLGVSKATLETWRCTGRYDLPFVRVGRAIRYNRADLDAFLARNTVGAA